jgi:hypothetical protein
VAAGSRDFGHIEVGSWTDIVQVAAGSAHTIGLKSDGTVVAVGLNDNDQLNVGSWTDIVQVAAGSSHTVGLKSDGTVVATWELQSFNLNSPPDKPTNVEPSDGATEVSQTPLVLRGTPFSDFDGNSQGGAHWIIDDDDDFSSPTYEIQPTLGGPTWELPSNRLEYSTTYFWRVRYEDEYGAWSEWSDATSFTTVTMNTYYLDGDSDGYGDPNDTIQAISLPIGYVANNQDCDDTDASINPGANEICDDGIDQDCNGSDLACFPDPNDVDNDGDGFSENQGDCDDTDASINPDASDVCGDGIDQNCDSNDAICEGGGGGGGGCFISAVVPGL